MVVTAGYPALSEARNRANVDSADDLAPPRPKPAWPGGAEEGLIQFAEGASRQEFVDVALMVEA